MELEMMKAMGTIGAAAAIALAGVGSALGTGAAGQASIGAWKKCYANNKQAPFQLLVFAGAPLTQTIYGLISTIRMGQVIGDRPESWPAMLLWGVLGGIAMGMSAWMQGKAGAGASDALAETGQGFANYLMVVGIVETVALFVMAMLLISV